MQQYFESEMRLLQEAAQEFAESFPEQAGMLNLNALKDRDPYIERLIEGTAYLTAHVKKRIDDGVPDISENILRQICPSLLKPYPSSCVIELLPKSTLQKSERVAKNTELKSRLIGKYQTQCRFRTCYDTTLLPLKVVDVIAEEKNTGGVVLKLQFRWNTAQNKSNFDVSTLRLYLHADPALTHSLFHALVGGLNQVSVISSRNGLPARSSIGTQSGVMPSFLNRTQGLVPNLGTTHPGFHLLQDYFSARERLYFVDVMGLEEIDWKDKDDGFTLEFDSGISLPPGTQLNSKHIRINCVPTINLFDSQAEPIKLNGKQMDYPIIPDVNQRKEVDVYSVNRVTGYDSKTGAEHHYQSICDMPVGGASNKRDEFHYNEMLRDPGTGNKITLLQILPSEENLNDTLSCEITATNSHLPRQTMQQGDLCFGGSGFPGFSDVINISRPTQCLLPPERKYFQWQLVRLLSLQMSSIADVDALQKLLSLFDWSAKPENQKRIQGISSLEISPIAKVLRGVFRQGVELQLQLDESFFSSISDMYLFGRVLHQFFSLYASINEFVQTKVICLPSYKEFLWQPQAGQKSPF